MTAAGQASLLKGRLRIPGLYRRGSEGPRGLGRVMQIGESPLPATDLVVPWSEVDEAPSVIQFSLVTIWPAADTAEAQLKLLEAIRSELGAQGQVDTRIVWVLNRHSVDVAGQLELGRTVPLRGIIDGAVPTELEDLRLDLKDLSFAIANVGSKGTSLGWWVRSDGHSRVPIAVMTRDTRWLLLPPFAGNLPRAVTSHIAPLPSRLALWGMMAGLICLWSLLVVLSLLRGRTDYQEQVADIGSGEFAAGRFPVPDVTAELETTWLPHPQRMVSRVLFENAEAIAGLATDLATTASPYELWRSGRETAFERSDAGSLAYYWLSLLTGDLPSAYRIVRESSGPIDGSGLWDQPVMNTLWQSAVESLHELDFPRSWMYTQLYLAASQRIAAQARHEAYGVARPDRNLTLARILYREFGDGSILSLCNGQNARDTFGWLLGGNGWGYRFPADDPPALVAMRETNRAEYCGEAAEATVDYGVLPELGILRARSAEIAATPPTEAVCSLAPLECTYLAVRAGLLVFPGLPSAERALSFARQCSYLSDDAVMDVLLWLNWEAGIFIAGAVPESQPAPESVSLNSLVQAMNCTSPQASDNYPQLETKLNELPCEQVSWDLPAGTVSASRHRSLAELERRCRA